jgi:predicted MFS family arabinose efflux permease
VQNTGSSQQGQALGTSFTGVNIAYALISLTVSSLTVSDWRFFYLIGSIPGLITIPLMYFFIKENRVSGKQIENRSLSLKSILHEARKKSLLLALVFNFISSLSFFGLGFFIPTYFVLGRSLSVAEASSIMFIQALSSIGSGSVAGYLADRFGVRLPVIISTLVMCIVVLLFPFIPLGLPMILLLIIWGVMGGWSFISMSVLVVQVVSPNVRGTFLGLYNEVGFISATIGPIILGFIIDISNFNMFFLACLIFYIASLISIVLINEEAT